GERRAAAAHQDAQPPGVHVAALDRDRLLPPAALLLLLRLREPRLGRLLARRRRRVAGQVDHAVALGRARAYRQIGVRGDPSGGKAELEVERRVDEAA